MPKKSTVKECPGLVYLTRRSPDPDLFTPVLLTTDDFENVLTLDWAPALKHLTVDQLMFVRVTKDPDKPMERSLLIGKTVPVFENGDSTTAEKIIRHWIKLNVNEFRSFIEQNAGG